MKDQKWVFHRDTTAIQADAGVERRVLAYTDGLMTVENSFSEGAIGKLHNHPHTQITYVVEGKFEFEIEGERKVVTAGDTMLKKDGIIHGCRCIQKGKLLDIFTPIREDFL